jgi:hypothetical protein
MADEGDVGKSPGMDSQADDDEIFLNGEEQNQRDNNLLHPEDNTLTPEGGIPRRSSLVKDASRRACRNKKTVSFSSMPTEKKIANGRQTFISDFSHSSKLMMISLIGSDYECYNLSVCGVVPRIWRLTWLYAAILFGCQICL